MNETLKGKLSLSRPRSCFSSLGLSPKECLSSLRIMPLIAIVIPIFQYRIRVPFVSAGLY